MTPTPEGQTTQTGGVYQKNWVRGEGGTKESVKEGKDQLNRQKT